MAAAAPEPPTLATLALDPALWTAAKFGREEEVRKLLADGADVEEKGGPELLTPLQIAIRQKPSWDSVDVVKLLLVYDADVSAKDKWGRTPLLLAQSRCPIAASLTPPFLEEMVWLLLEHNADVSQKDNSGDTPLHYAACGGREEMVRLHLAKGANVSARNVHGLTPLHNASGSVGKDAVVRILLQHGADVSANARGGTPLHHAARHGRSVVVRLLLDKGADLTCKTDDDLPESFGKTAEDLATLGSHLGTAAMLKAEAARRAKCEAFAMGQQERLGAASCVQELDPGVVRMVLDHV